MGMRFLLRVWPFLAAALGGVLLAGCFPGFEISVGLVWVWSVPLFLGLWLGGGERRKWFGFFVGLVSGLGFWLVNLKWLISMGELETVPLGGAMFGWFALSFYMALYFGVWGMFVSGVGNPWREQKRKALSGIEARIAEKSEAKVGRDSGFKKSLRTLGYGVMHASFWVLLEWLRGWLMTGFGWNGLGVAFHEVLVIAQLADVVGVAGLSFLPILVVSVALQVIWGMVGEVRAGKFRPHWEIGVTLGLVACAFSYGVNRMGHFSGVETRDVRVLLVQENIPQSAKWDERLQAQQYQGYLESTFGGLERLEREDLERVKDIKEGEVFELRRPDFVIFPESAMTEPLMYVEGEEGFYLSPQNAGLINAVMKDSNFKLIFGANLMEAELKGNRLGWMEQGVGRDYNVLSIVDPAILKEEASPFETIQVYKKNHLVIFGEYLPAIPGLDWVMEKSSGAKFGSNFSRGEVLDPVMVEVRGEDLGIIPSVCFEDTVGRLERKFVRPGAQLMVNVTNDGWFAKSEAAAQQVANAKFRSIELRRPLVRSANTGVSCVVDVMGSLVDPKTGERQVLEKDGDHFVRGTLYGVARVPVEGEITIYALLGDWFVGLCGVMFLGGLVRLKFRN